MEIRTVAIEEYWPLIVKNTAEFGQIANAENPEFNELAQCIYRALHDSFVLDATDYGVRRWEAILDITPAVGATLDERKVAILNFLSIKLPYTWRVLKEMIASIVGGEDKFAMNYINDECKLILYTNRCPDDKLQTINGLLERVLPQNIIVECDNLPLGYKRVEYLEGTGTQWILTDVKVTQECDVNCVCSPTSTTSTYVFGARTSWAVDDCAAIAHSGTCTALFGQNALSDVEAPVGSKVSILLSADKITINDTSNDIQTEPFETPNDIQLFGLNRAYFFIGRIYSFSIRKSGQLQLDLIPCLDDTGKPCMYDQVSKKAFYNQGTGEFLCQ